VSALRRRVLEALLSQGPWVQRCALDGLTGCAPALDDVLADLVVEGVAEFKPSLGYRVCGGPLVREVHLRMLCDPQACRHTVALERATDAGPQIVAAMALRMPDGGTVAFALELPPAASPQLVHAQADALLRLATRGGA
jgi:hypothetical protein